jgi:integrase
LAPRLSSSASSWASPPRCFFRGRPGSSTWSEAPFSKEGDYVFTTRTGTPFSQRNVTKRGLEKAADAVGLNRPGERLHSHDLRHTCASMLIREGADVVFVARQLGHANPAITLRVYAHLFDSEAQSARMREALETRLVVTRW